MRFIRRLWARTRNFATRSTGDCRLREEMEQHLALQTQVNIRAGMENRGEVARNGSKSLDWMGVPLKVNSHTFGALVVQTYSKNIRYGERDKEILTFVARQVASAVEIKRNEQALRRSEARYRSLVQSSVYGIYRSSLEGRFLDVNPALITMMVTKSLSLSAAVPVTENT